VPQRLLPLLLDGSQQLTVTMSDIRHTLRRLFRECLRHQRVRSGFRTPPPADPLARVPPAEAERGRKSGFPPSPLRGGGQGGGVQRGELFAQFSGLGSEVLLG